MTKDAITFNPRQVTRDLLASVPERARNIIRKRFGLESKDGMTLEAVGQIYNITRERVRQIEDFTIKLIKKSPAYAEAQPIFVELQTVMDSYGGIVHEGEFINFLTNDKVVQNNIHFLLVLGDAFTRLREDEAFHHRWTTDENKSDMVHQSLKNLCQRLSADDLLSEQDILDTFVKNLHEDLDPEEAKKHSKNWLRLSKQIGKSPIGEWGLAKSPNVRVRGIRDYAFLVMRRHGSPMHFTEVAKAINSTFERKANSATTHNELIKDDRFVLVGRGIYALINWGYTRGVVRDVIKNLIQKHGPLTKDEVMAKVKKERYVKDNTILVNLKNPKFFKQNKEGKFVIV